MTDHLEPLGASVVSWPIGAEVAVVTLDGTNIVGTLLEVSVDPDTHPIALRVGATVVAWHAVRQAGLA